MFRSYCDVAPASPFSAIAIFVVISSCVSPSILAAYACPATVAPMSVCTVTPRRLCAAGTGRNKRRGDAQGGGDVTRPHARILGDAQHPGVTGKEAPALHIRESIINILENHY